MAEDSHQAGGRSEQTRGKIVIVGIGASAGGIQALQSFFAALPPNTGAAYVVVVHLDPQHRSELPLILATRTEMPVVQVGGPEKLQPNHVYVIPPDRNLEVTDEMISAGRFDEPHGYRLPIDTFFRSLAKQLGDGFAVILSGAGSDGTLGARAVKESGGIILIQEPGEAEYPSMPRSAIETEVADFVLPVSELAVQLADLVASKQNVPTAEREYLDEDLVRRILAHVRVRTGHNFAKYKRSTVLRRIARRMHITRTNDLRGYYEFLRDNADESQALLSDLLISVTTFFRDSEVFQFLARRVLPHLLDGKDPAHAVRVWVPGCATGEEAYTIAMLLLESLAGQRDARPPIQVFGTDLDTRALMAAREGLFPTAIEVDVNEDRLRRFFSREGDHYRVKQELRDIVLFALHDLLKDPPFSRVDFISCRNVLIYLDRDLQEQVCGTFHYALNPGGYLLLGSSETAESPPGLFRVVDRSARIFQSTSRPGDKPRLLPRLLGPIQTREQVTQVSRTLSPAAALTEAVMHRRAIEATAPPSILVDEMHRVVHLSEHAGRYLLPSGGPLSGDVVDLVRPELRFELRSALHRVFEHNKPILSLPIPVCFNGAAHRVHVLVKPASGDSTAEPRHVIVMLIEGEAFDETLVRGDKKASDETVRRLSEELELAQARLQTVREESEATNEELRAGNEELQSINEEYRSTSEELETSKEELQSINEELQTVNSELKVKLETISRAHSDLQNLMAATDIGTLFLDANLRIKRFTTPVTHVFSITSADEGRSITDFAHQFEDLDLVQDARTVLSNLAPIRREVRSRAGRWYDVRLRPYRTVDDKIDGVVVTFVDISERLQVEEALRASEVELRQKTHLLDLSRDPILIWDFDGGIVEWNRGCEELYGYIREEALGKQKEKLLGTTVPNSSFAELKATLLKNGSWRGELKHKAKDGRELTVESRILLETLDGQRLVLESTRDITDQKTWAQRQQMLLGELTHRVKNTLAVVQSIAQQTLRNSDSSEDFIERFGGRLAAMGRAHSILVQSEWHGADFASLARAQLEPFAPKGTDGLRPDGGPIILPADLATPFGLVLHELAANAAKYGAFSRSGGTVNLSWTLSSRNRRRVLNVVWSEKGGPRVRPPAKTGLGSTLIDNVVAGATVRREYRPDGLFCTIELPLAETQTHAGPGWRRVAPSERETRAGGRG